MGVEPEDVSGQGMVAPAEITTVVRLLCTGREFGMSQYQFPRPEAVLLSRETQLRDAVDYVAKSIHHALTFRQYNSPSARPVIKMDVSQKYSFSLLEDAVAALATDLRASGWRAVTCRRPQWTVRNDKTVLEIELHPIAQLGETE